MGLQPLAFFSDIPSHTRQVENLYTGALTDQGVVFSKTVTLKLSISKPFFPRFQM